MNPGDDSRGPNRNGSAPFGSIFGLGRHRNRGTRSNARTSASTSTSGSGSSRRSSTSTPFASPERMSRFAAGSSLPSMSACDLDLTPGVLSPKLSSKRKASSSPKSANPHDPVIRATDIYNADTYDFQPSSFGAEGSSMRPITIDDLDEFRDWRHMLLPQPIVAQNQNFNANARGNGSSRHRRLYRTLSTAIPRTSESMKKILIPPSAVPFALLDYTDSPTRPPDSTLTRYLPLCSAAILEKGYNAKDLTILPSHRRRIDQKISIVDPPISVQWPAEVLPVEMFDLITAYLARDDVKAMRLVNHEFERKVSRSLFYTSVVPFNTELYDMIDEETKSAPRAEALKVSRPDNGKGRAMAEDDLPQSLTGTMETTGLHWKNAKDDAEGKVYKGHGLRVFQGFGPHIKRFGISFEVSEEQLSQPPHKKELDNLESYHGPYSWPTPYYARFDNLAGLERTADETSRMKAAFQHLRIVQELALCIDSGLGWLSGPDKSVHARIFERPSAVFGRSAAMPDQQMQAATEFWAALSEASRQSWRLDGDGSNLKELTLLQTEMLTAPAQLNGISGLPYSQSALWSSIERLSILPELSWRFSEDTGYSMLCMTNNQPDHADTLGGGFNFSPATLRKEQKEWLLETEWAQRAFLESYMLAIIDNPAVFEEVTVLNIAKLSSSFLPIIARPAFWDALPALQNLTVYVSADWRSVAKDEAGFAELTAKNPSGAVNLFYGLLRQRIAPIANIMKLKIGWVGGGEHAQGICARNHHLLPAPVTQLDHSLISTPFGLTFPHVTDLTLYNCWITPPTLEGLVNRHADEKLERLTLNSVSLTAHPRFAAPAQPAPPQVIPMPPAGLPPAALAALQQQTGAAGVAQFMPNPPPVGQGGNVWHIGGHPPANPPMPPANTNANGLNVQQVFQWQQWMQGQMQANLAAGINSAAAHWTTNHREGSWPHLLNNISPGTTFAKFDATAEDPFVTLPERPPMKLRSIDIKSCGYAMLASPPFDQAATVFRGPRPSTWFRTRHAALKPMMLDATDRFFGTISPYIPERELDALRMAWQITEGWADAEKAAEATYDGCVPGGTGRITGTISI